MNHELEIRRHDAYRMTATLGGRDLAYAVHDCWGWSIHSRRPDGAFATVARVDEGLSPGLARSFALMKLHAAASARLVGAA